MIGTKASNEGGRGALNHWCSERDPVTGPRMSLDQMSGRNKSNWRIL